ncbi:hypothetical protein QE152_g4121 [Popillia japonica]|uniref:Zinc-finger domain-containing protein n=1 Tax=Popillia japonica TaxID=7064 RepID=A0AAW1MXN4_POPJA
MERNCSEEHEEGEIIDDFEDISDYSMHSTSYSGKSVSNQDLLQGVSLSSISDNEADSVVYETYSSRHKNGKRRRRSLHGRRRKRYKPIEYYNRQHRFHRYTHSSHDSDSSDAEMDITMQKQLKEAIRIEPSHIQTNSLRTRLKAMLHPENVQEKSDDEDAEALRALALLSNVKAEAKDIPKNEAESVDEKDDELIELRLAALKSAVLKKAPEIRKRKRKQQPNQNEKVYEVNKENNANQENNNIVVKEDNENIRNVELVEGKAEKNEIDSSRSISVDEDIDIMRAKLLASMAKKISSDLPIQNTISIVSKENNVKPIVIEKNNFSKHQLTVKPLIINLNDSDSDTDVTTVRDPPNTDEKELNLVNSVSAFLKKQRAAVEAKTVAQTDRKIALDKSVLKLLPKSQQREYQLLKQKLLLAKRKRLRKNTCGADNSDGTTAKKVINQDVSIKRTTDSKPVLQKALDDIQVKKNGRLQMKGKYKALAPLLQKVNQARIERKQCELEIKTLLERLQKARDKLAVSHQSYTNLVMRLTSQKNAIDRRIVKMHTTKLIVNNNVNVSKTTSTPIKCNIQESVCDISSIQNNSHENVKEVRVDTNGAQEEPKEEVLPQIPQPTNIEEVLKCDNDNNALKQYVSPLDSKNRDTVDDPLMTFCPYELFGVCKDSECKFNHCSKT